MYRIVRRLVALLTFAAGIVAVWYIQQPTPSLSRFEVRIPPAPVPLTPEQIAELPQECGNFVVSIEEDGSLKLNESADVGSVEDPSKLSAKLHEMFQERVSNRVFAEEMQGRTDLSDEERALKVQVTIRAPRTVPYGDVMRVVDAAKGGGASPVFLQIDGLPK